VKSFAIQRLGPDRPTDSFEKRFGVEVISREDQVVVGFVPREVPRCLTNRVGRPLIPVGIVRRLFRCEDLHETAAEQIHPVRLPDVPVQRRGVVLRQDEDAPS
jgi:hypothetical protein